AWRSGRHDLARPVRPAAPVAAGENPPAWQTLHRPPTGAARNRHGPHRRTADASFGEKRPRLLRRLITWNFTIFRRARNTASNAWGSLHFSSAAGVERGDEGVGIDQAVQVQDLLAAGDIKIAAAEPAGQENRIVR